jgi:hypothetical protein
MPAGAKPRRRGPEGQKGDRPNRERAGAVGRLAKARPRNGLGPRRPVPEFASGYFDKCASMARA